MRRHPHAPRRLVAVVATAVVALIALMGSQPASARGRAPHSAQHLTATIEDYTAYVEQDDCDPTVKRGTRMLGDLLEKTYPDTIWYSTRPCVAGSASEHYDGRAIDWMASVKDKRQHHEAHMFWKWLLGTDKFGNRFAMARRLGVMYIIYNNRMWGMWDGKWEDYNGCEAKKMQKPEYDNACHRTHVHISLSWNGAHGRTTFWTGKVFRTDYGPCRKPGHTYAPKWTKPNYEPCP